MRVKATRDHEADIIGELITITPCDVQVGGDSHLQSIPHAMVMNEETGELHTMPIWSYQHYQSHTYGWSIHHNPLPTPVENPDVKF